MSLISLPFVFSPGSTIIASQHNTNNQTIFNDYNGNIDDDNISSDAGIEYTKLALSNTIKSTDILSSTTFNTINLGSGTANSSTVLLGNSTWGQIPYIKCTNTQSSGTGGGNTTLGGWNTCILNTKDNDTASIASISSNAISLPIGTYQTKFIQMLHNTGSALGGQIRLYNSTDSAILINGINAPATGNNTDTQSIGSGQFTISGTKSVILQYYVNNSITNGLGNPYGFGTEVYAIIELWKVG